MIQFDLTMQSLISFYLSPVMSGIMAIIGIFFLIAIFIQKYPNSTIVLIFDMLYEKIYTFYSSILWDEVGKNIRLYVTTLFFVIFFANIAGVILDFIAPVFGISSSWDFYLSQYITMPTADMQFNIGLALFSTLLLLYVQFGSLGFKKFFYSYLPVFGKGYIEVEQGSMSKYLYYPLFTIAKGADIIISLFLGLLDIVGLFAKIISLSFRLFWNMTSGTILLGMLIIGMTAFSQNITGFIGGINFPIIFPILIYLQGLLVAIIQAMVFPLLVAIFIRMAQMERV